ncbi:Carboxylic ester hydrolase [Mycena indigotica]|uniref:Carboxylic ester hydrolase n=1 Tax=Mycena indigotica TaxID=2126181 RepID=A0A8H6SDH8_9AGAR|nr:Carboxylic ester hydrolase [Mycena indigotica]KAF7296947.1 Carboxylic ester hydrolase [Mycena indigotica]
MVPFLVAEMLTLYIGVFLCGIYVVTAGMAGRALLTLPTGQWRTLRELSWILVVVFMMILINTIVQTTLLMVQAMDAFALYTGPGGPAKVFTRGSAWLTLTKTTCVGIQTLMGDAILIWRCWFVWKAKTQLVIVLPVMGWIANCVLNAWVDQLLSKVSSGLVTGSKIQPFGRAFWILSICINIYATSLIVLRLWMVERSNSQFRVASNMNNSGVKRPRSPLNRAIRNIVEGGMLITVSSILMCIAFTTQSTLNFPASAFAFHSVGISYNLIIIRSASRASPELSSSRNQASIHLHSNAPGGHGIRTTTTVITDAKQDAYPLSHLPTKQSVDYVV